MLENQKNKSKSHNDKLLIGVFVGAFIGLLIYWSLDVLTVYSESVFKVLIVVAIIFAIVILLFTWFRNRIIKRFFGKNVDFNSIVVDTRDTIQLIYENITDSLPIESEKKEKIKVFAPKLINYIIWSNFRNWGLRIFTSFVLGLGGIVTTILILNQNKLFDNQNKRIEQQTHLIEAERRSAQIFILGDILSDISKELANKENKDTLSNTLVGRIIGLSSSMKRYRYLKDDRLIKEAVSPERAQLLIALLESGMEKRFLGNRIFSKTDFSFSDLNNARLSGKYLDKCNLAYSQIENADMDSIVIYRGNWTGVDFSHKDMKHSSLSYLNLNGRIMDSVDFAGSKLNFINFNGTSLIGANFQGASLTGFSGFNRVDLRNSDLTGFYIDEDISITNVDLRYAKMDYRTVFPTNMDSIKIERKDWAEYVTDSLKVKGLYNLKKRFKLHYMDYDKELEGKEMILVRYSEI